MSFVEDETDKLDVLFTKSGTYCKPKQNITVERYRFNTHIQESSEIIDQYVTELKLIAKNCGYGELEDQLIRDRIVCGIKSETVKQCLLHVENLTLDKAISICRAEEQSKKDAQFFLEPYMGYTLKPLEAETKTQAGLHRRPSHSWPPVW